MYQSLIKWVEATRIFTVSRFLYRKKISVLMYHGIRTEDDSNTLTEYNLMHVPVQQFRKQMLYLKKHYHVISLSQAMNHIEGKRSLPNNSVVITFDDGYRNNYTLGWPVWKELDLPVTIYAVTDFIQNQDLLWPDRLMLAIATTTKAGFELAINDQDLKFSLSTKQEKDEAYLCLLQMMKSMNQMCLSNTLETIEERLRVNRDLYEEHLLSPCTWNQLKEMVSSGLVEIGAHTVGHRILTRLSEENGQKELIESKNQIESQLNATCAHFAYPNGSSGDFNTVTEKWVKDAGFKSAVTTIEGFNTLYSNPFTLNRLGIYGHYTPAGFASMVSGFHTILVKTLTQGHS